MKIGDKFGRLLIVEYRGRQVYPSGASTAVWLVRCDCGVEKEVLQQSLRGGTTQSCGCLRKERVRASRTTHGLRRTPEYLAYYNARNRCTNPKTKYYCNYGGRGIQFKFTSVEQWLAELGLRPSPKHSVDRKDNDGHYEPGNVRWATAYEQRQNQRRRLNESVSEFLDYVTLLV